MGHAEGLLEPSRFKRSSLKEATFPQNTKDKEEAEKEPERDQTHQPPRDDVVVFDLEHVLGDIKLRILYFAKCGDLVNAEDIAAFRLAPENRRIRTDAGCPFDIEQLGT